MTKITVKHLNIALDLAAKRGAKAQDITSLAVSATGEAVTIGLGLDKDGLARFVSNHGFGL